MENSSKKYRGLKKFPGIFVYLHRVEIKSMILREEIDAILSNAVLKEERGVAAYKYKGAVDEIIRY